MISLFTLLLIAYPVKLKTASEDTNRDDFYTRSSSPNSFRSFSGLIFVLTCMVLVLHFLLKLLSKQTHYRQQRDSLPHFAAPEIRRSMRTPNPPAWKYIPGPSETVYTF